MRQIVSNIIKLRKKIIKALFILESIDWKFHKIIKAQILLVKLIR